MNTRSRINAIVTAALLIATSITTGGLLIQPAAAEDSGAVQQDTTAELPSETPVEGTEAAAAVEAPAEETEAAAPEPATDSAEPPAEDGTDAPAAPEVPAPTTATEPTAPAAPAEPTEPAVPTSTEVGALDAAHGALWASVDLFRVTLSDGALMDTPKGHVSAIAPGAATSATNLFYVTGTYNDAAATGLDATVVYRIRMDMPNAPDENTWLKTRIYESRGSTHAQCEIYRGDPRTGGTVMDPGAYTCFPHQTQGFPNVRYTFSIEMNRYVESSGTVHATGPVSLAGGRYYFEQPFRIPGSTTVDAAGTTTFSTVMRESDGGVSVEGDMAKTRFSYRIQDTQTINGVPTVVPTKYFVAGVMSRNRSGTSEASCWIFDVSPEGSTSWRDLPQAKAAPFACAASWERVDSGHAAGTFTVSKRELTVIPASDGPRQGDLYRDVCSVRPEDCDLRLATVVSRPGEARAMSGKWGNPNGKGPEQHLFKFTSKQAVTTTFGSEVTLGVEGGGFGLKYKAEIKASFEYEIATETSISDEQHVEIERGERAYIAGAPTIVHTEGDIYVLHDDRLFLLQGVVADFPLAGDNTWNYWVEYEAIPGWSDGGTGGLGGVRNPPLTGLEPGSRPVSGTTAGVRGAAGTRGSVHTSRLAHTGGSPEPALATAGVLLTVGTLLAAGGTLVVVRRRRLGHGGR